MHKTNFELVLQNSTFKIFTFINMSYDMT